MDIVVLAHGNGWDEILIGVVSFGIIGALIFTARSRANAEQQASTSSDESLHDGAPTSSDGVPDGVRDVPPDGVPDPDH